MRALAEGGLGAVGIEPIAARLGATKGSGYWHFRDRADLVGATLARWEQEHTDQVIARVGGGADPANRLRELFRVVLGRSEPLSVELALLASAEDPLVTPTITRVTQRRLDYLEMLFTDLGWDPTHARERALLAYTSYLGHAGLARTNPGAVPTGGAERAAYLDSVLATLLAPAGRPDQARP
jgi:AcrR family transcriptional regulator